VTEAKHEKWPTGQFCDFGSDTSRSEFAQTEGKQNTANNRTVSVTRTHPKLNSGTVYYGAKREICKQVGCLEAEK